MISAEISLVLKVCGTKPRGAFWFDYEQVYA